VAIRRGRRDRVRSGLRHRLYVRVCHPREDFCPSKTAALPAAALSTVGKYEARDDRQAAGGSVAGALPRLRAKCLSDALLAKIQTRV